MGIHTVFRLANRAAIEDEIERLIALLDCVDGDCDLEDDDPAGTVLDRGEGVGLGGQGLLPMLPMYGSDQTTGPINYPSDFQPSRMRGVVAA